MSVRVSSKSCLVAAALLGAALCATRAAATVTYSFTETGASFGDAAFTYVTPDFITAASSTFTPQVCAVTPNANTTDANVCDPMTAERAPTGFNVNSDYIGFNYSAADLSGGGTGYFFFALGALTHAGVYSTAGQPGNACQGAHGCVGSAGEGLLTVTSDGPQSAAPEPAAWLMMLLGFAAVGAAARRRPVLASRAGA